VYPIAGGEVMGAINYTLEGEESRLQLRRRKNSGGTIQRWGRNTDYMGSLITLIGASQTEARSRGIPWEHDGGQGQLQYETTEGGSGLRPDRRSDVYQSESG